VTEQGILELENALRRVADRTKTASGEPLLLNVYTLAGQTVSDQRPRRGNHLGSVHTELLKTERRGIFFEEIAAEWEKEFGHYPGVESLTFAGLSAGPPGAAIEIWVQGHDLDQIAAAADELKEKLMSYDGVYQAQHDFRPGKSELHFRLKPEAATLGLTVADLARQVYAGYFGEEAVRQQRGRDDVRVRVRYAANERRRVADLQHMRIRTPFGTEVPLHSVAEVEFGPGYTDIHRTDGMRRATVTAEVNSAKGNAQEIISELKTAYFPALERKYPGIRVSQQGEKKKMMDSIFGVVMPASLGLMGIYTVIALTFRSYIQPMVIMITVPFGLIGAVLGHMILGYELSMMSIFGMVALTGVVVNDAIVLIERVNQNLAEGIPFMESVRLAGVRRFRAIFLTTITTVGGLGPIILERDLQAKFLIPMAISLAAGVAFATLLTLIVVPCLLVVLNDLRRAAHWLITGHFPTQEAVEPGRLRNLDLDAEYAAGNGATIPVK
jgi:multidrug efflux pump subunit AcrB